MIVPLTLMVTWFKVVALALGVLVLLRARVPTSWLKSLIAAILAILVIHLYAVSRHDLFGLDFQFFWKAGCDVWGGVDPYSPSRFAEHPFLNPPTALPLFALFAALPIRASLAFWTLLNVSSSLGLIALSRSALLSQDRLDVAGRQVRGGLESLPPVAIAGLAICLSFSEASLKGFYLGQLGVFTAVMLVLALVAQGRGRPISAGVCLFLATVKFVTMIPFLVLFLRPAGPLDVGGAHHPGRGVVRFDRKDHRVARSRGDPVPAGRGACGPRNGQRLFLRRDTKRGHHQFRTPVLPAGDARPRVDPVHPIPGVGGRRGLGCLPRDIERPAATRGCFPRQFLFAAFPLPSGL